jgi:hypothetical protein
MLINRCAWHPQYRGRRSWPRIVSLWGFSIQFTDGICRRCLEQFRIEHRHMLEGQKVKRLDRTA